MHQSRGSVGTAKHRTSGKSPNVMHFTGPKRQKRIRRGKMTRKQRRAQRRVHINKYAHMKEA